MDENNEESLDMLRSLGFVKCSKYRIKTLKTLKEYPKIPSEIANELEIDQKHISATLKQLRENGLVECINPEVRKGRLYRLTERGEKLFEMKGFK